jgi:hypothetical protein
VYYTCQILRKFEREKHKESYACFALASVALAGVTDFCLGGVFDPNVTSEDRERELWEEGEEHGLGCRVSLLIATRSRVATPIKMMMRAPLLVSSS